MYTDCEAIILRQIKTLNGRRMIVLLTEKYGKISAGTSINEKGKNKSTLALRPFTFGRYELYKNKDSFNLNGAETKESFYSIGEDVDKYMAASYVLELTDLLVPENQPAPGMLNMLHEYLALLEKRKSSYDTLMVAFMLKALSICGMAPRLSECAQCGQTDNFVFFSVPDGGLICKDCRASIDGANSLIFEISNDIINVTRYIQSHPLRSLDGLALPKQSEAILKQILKSYYSYHLGIQNLKSEGLQI
ncbi:MAG: DNA repair protein RecO [Clostridia bacterium]|nr:DNA repair protein RecO [Clostridia bacterium]